MIETFGQCLSAWLIHKELNVTLLTRALGLRSNTTINRARADECTVHQCEKLLSLIAERSLLDETWTQRFQSALQTMRWGREKAEFYRAMSEFMLSAQPRCCLCYPPSKCLPKDTRQVLILGCVGQESIPILQEAIDRRDIHIRHIMTPEELLRSPDMLATLTHLIPELQYEAFLLPQVTLLKSRLPWNAMVILTDSESLFGAWNGSSHVFFPTVASGKTLAARLRSLDPEPIYHYDNLSTGSDYVSILKNCLNLEKNRRLTIIRGMPSIGMIPTAYVANSFYDHAPGSYDTLLPIAETLRTLLEARRRNFETKKTSTHMVFREDALDTFVRTGVLEDHFFACRPFTEAERRGSIASVLELAAKPNVTLAMITGREPPRFSLEVYRGVGVLLYPTQTSYSTQMGGYREMLLPGDLFAEIVEGYIHDVFIPQQCVTGEAARQILIHAIDRLKGGASC